MTANALPPSAEFLQTLAGSFSEIRSNYGGLPFLVRHKDFEIENLEELLPRPQRKSQVITLTEPESFVGFVNNQKEENTVIFANERALTAVLNFHGKASDAPNWGDYKAVLQLTNTVEWSRWMGKNCHKFDQLTFAQFLEENELLFVEPNGAALLELVQTLQGKSDVRFNSAMRLQSGQHKLTYEEDVVLTGSTGTQQGQIDLPSRLVLGIAPYEGTTKYKVEARLRYRIEQRKLMFWYETINPHFIIKDALAAVIQKVKEGTGIQPFIGNF